MPRALALLIAAIALVLTISLVWMARQGEDAAVAHPPTPEIPRVDPAPAHTSPLASVAEPNGRSGATKSGAPDRTTLGIAPRAAAREPADLVVVRVVEGASSLPMGDAEVSLQSPGHPTVYGVTDERGEFDFSASEVPAALGEKVSVVVKDEDGHERLRDGVVLARNVLLHAPSKAVLRGEIALVSGESPEWLYVSIWSRSRKSRSGETFVGYQNLGPDGRFAIPALGERPPEFVRIEVARTGLPANLRMPTTELLVPPGPRIVVGLTRLQIAVVDDAGEPVPDALVCCMADAAQDELEALLVEPSTGLDGLAHLWVPSGGLTIQAGRDAHAPTRVRATASGPALEVVLRLRKLGPSDRLHGSVVYEDGSVVPDLAVSGWNDDPSGRIARVSAATARTDGEGRFVLPIALDQDVGVRAVDPATGEAGRATWTPGDGPVKVVIDRGHALDIRGRGLPDAADGEKVSVTIVLVSERDRSDAFGFRDRARVKTLETDALPVTFEHVPAGRWSVYALDRRRERWARGEIRMTGAAAEEIALEFEPLLYVAGRVEPEFDPELSYSVAFVPSGWADDAVDALLTADVARDRSFRVPAPGLGDVVLREGYRTVERRPAVGGGAPLVFTLPD